MMDLVNVSWFTGLLPVVSKYGFAAVGLAAVITLLVLTPTWVSPTLRRILIWAAVILGYGFVVYTVGVHDENQRWDKWYKAAVKAEAENGERIRADVEAQVRAEWEALKPVPNTSGGPAARSIPDSVRLNKWNRDNWGKAGRPKG